MDPEFILKQLGIDLIREADHLVQLDEGSAYFKILARGHDKSADGTWPGATLMAAIEKAEGGDEEWLLNGIASSTIKDRHGDVMLPTALIDMERAANDNLTMFLNHEYKVPEDVAGTVKTAKIVSFGVEQDTGAPIYDLDYAFRVNKINERAKDSFLAIKGNTKLGLSIGARIPEGGAIRNKKTGRLLIAHVDLLETSIVGVPANPRSWVEMAVRSMNAPTKVFQGVDLAASITVGEDGPEEVLSELQTSEGTGEPMEAIEVALGETATITSEEGVESPEVIQSAPSQDAPPSTPGSDGLTASDDAGAASEPPAALADLERRAPTELVQAVLTAQAALSETSMALIQSQEALRQAEERALNAERERDRVVRGASDLAIDTAQIIQRIGSLPIGHRASFRRIQQDFNDGLESAKDVYGEETIALLRSMTNKP